MGLGRKTITAMLLGGALALTGCGDDDRRADFDAGGGGDTDAGGGDTDAGGGGDEPPTITMVEWTQVSGCSAATASDVTVTVTVDDPDTAAGDLTFSGSVTGCTGSLDAATSTVNCPQVAPYSSTVTVTDPEGGSDTASFTIGVCEDGSFEP